MFSLLKKKKNGTASAPTSSSKKKALPMWFKILLIVSIPLGSILLLVWVVRAIKRWYKKKNEAAVETPSATGSANIKPMS